MISTASIRHLHWHDCGRRHLSGRSFAACAFAPDFAQRGTGQWAVVSNCAIRFVSLHASKSAAVAELEQIDGNDCGRACTFQHELVFIDLLHARGDIAIPTAIA